ncbi:MAG: lipid IV(A) 3-deoxy-D-manno-octulosonic acid transferase [Pseudomonadota bacterium]
MRYFYNALVLVGLPFVAVYWLWRALTDKTYRSRWVQRFGFAYPRVADGVETVWVHAVSVGEVQAAAPLIRALRERMPEARVLITTVTPTGADRVRLLFADSVEHAYVPYDVAGAVRRFYRAVAPRLAIIVETELWPNLYHEAGLRRIPLILASARISPRSMPRYRRLVGLFRDALSNGIIIAAQSEVDRQRFVELGAPAERTFVSGNIKFDFDHDPDVQDRGARFRQDMLGERPVWVAASTHAGEESILLDAHTALLETVPDALLIMVPRHPVRFDEAAVALDERKLSYLRRTADLACPPEVSVLLGDTMGEVNMFYAAADIAFVGGSLVPVGGHNLLEPAALGLPILAGPYLFNAQDIANLFTGQGAAKTVQTADELCTSLQSLFRRGQLRDSMGRRAEQLIVANRGAVDRLLTRLEPLIEQGGLPPSDREITASAAD